MITRLSGFSFHQEALGLRLLFAPLTYTMGAKRAKADSLAEKKFTRLFKNIFVRLVCFRQKMPHCISEISFFCLPLFIKFFSLCLFSLAMIYYY
ncbi:hypothetical protein [uncultured Phascolarctobacterium sp.]|jgi:hypothetical protein|uniref:hypothetical protein n=1 Tax=uncultured Phascolarctobacterium sp. TaxID=512296 RepID=UPI0025F7D783|nr:hypothetical protein [uncultured Phascolarctobacterium sp.]